MSHDRVSARGRAPASEEADLRDQLDAPDVARRRNAAVGLVEMAADGLDSPTVVALTQQLQAEEDADVRQFAVEALGVDGGPAAGIERGLEDDDPWVRAEAVVAFSRANPDDIETLRAYLDDESGWVRRNAVIALGKVGAAEQSELIERIRSDPHPPVREFAAQFLGEAAADREEAVRILAAVLAREPNAFVRAKAAESLGKLGTDRAEEALESQGLPDRSDAVQRAARRALATARGTDPSEIDLPDTPAPGGGPEYPEESPAGPQQSPTYEDLGGGPR